MHAYMLVPCIYMHACMYSVLRVYRCIGSSIHVVVFFLPVKYSGILWSSGNVLALYTKGPGSSPVIANVSFTSFNIHNAVKYAVS